MDTSKDSDKLLENHLDSAAIDSNNGNDVDQYLQNQKYDSRRICRYKFIGAVLILLLISTNLAWYWGYRHLSYDKPVQGPAEWTYFLEESDPKTILVPFNHDWVDLLEVEEGVGGYRYADEHWEHWAPPGGGSVAVPRKFQKSLNLDPRATTTSDNSSNVHYLVAGYHQLHCLGVIRDTIYQLNGTLSDAEPLLWDHVLHCIEAVRQGLACFLDPTLVPLDEAWPGVPNGQLHVCRNSDALFRWSTRFRHPLPEYMENHNTPHTQEWLDRHEGRKAQSHRGH